MSSGEPLYALGNELAAVLADLESQLADSGGELTPEMEERFNAVNLPWTEKVVRVALYAKSLKTDADLIRKERARLAKRRDVALKQAVWLLGTYLPREMQRADRSVVRDALHTVKLAAGRERVEVEFPASFLPRAFQRERPATFEPDKEAIMQAHKRGEALPEGVRVVRGDPVAKVS